MEMLEEIPDGNSNLSLVILSDDGNLSRLTPHCKHHGAMNKVSEQGIWRCLRAEPDQKRYNSEERKKMDCRAGCIWRG